MLYLLSRFDLMCSIFDSEAAPAELLGAQPPLPERWRHLSAAGPGPAEIRGMAGTAIHFLCYKFI